MKLKRIVLILVFLSASLQALHAQCGSAYISSDDTVVCVPKVIQFKVHNFPAGTTFEWDMGSGYVSSDSTFIKLYGSGGDYNVRVKLKYQDGSSCIIDKIGFIQAKAIPVPQFSISRDIICKYDDSFTLSDITPRSASRDWLVDNTLYSNGPKNLRAIFHAPYGFKSFTIFLKDSFGCSGKKTFDSVAFVHDSISVDFSADQTSGCIPKTVNFQNLTNTKGYAVNTWNWSFPGGANPASSSGFEPGGVLYNLRDTFDVTLTLTTVKGCTYSHTKPSYLMYADSVLISAAFSKTVLCTSEKLTVNLINTRSGTPELKISPASHTDTALTPTRHRIKFTNYGTYSVYISDVLNGCRSEKTYSNYIQANGPVARIFVPDKYSCLKPDTLKVFDSSYLNTGLTRTLKWDLFNDSLNPGTSIQTGSSNPIGMVCPLFSTYSVRLIISANNGCADTVVTKAALTIRKLLPDFIWQPKSACPSEMVYFSNSTPRGTSKAENRYRWTFYNLQNGVIFRDTIQNPRLNYPDTGKYNVKLLVFNNLGCRDSVTKIRKVIISKPVPDFIAYDSNVCYKVVSRFKARYKDSNYYTDYNHRWHFQHKDSANQKYSFTGDSINVDLFPGEYIIKYTRHSVRGTCFDTFPLSIRLRVSGARYIQSVTPIKVCNPFTATLNAQLLNNYNFKNNSIDPITHTWTHGYDTNRVAIRFPAANPTYAYVKKNGQFNFKFKYKHPSGCSDSMFTQTLTSGVKAVIYSPNYACIGKPLYMENRSEKEAVKFKWFMKDSGSASRFLPSDTSKHVRILFQNEGVFKLGLIAYGNGSCSDTVYHTLKVYNIQATFTSTDTLNYCAPIIATVSAKRHPAIIEYRWYLGDGDSVTNNVSTFSHLYTKNTGPDGSDVRLVVRSYGCNDTLDKKGYIRVIGPIPKFRLANNNGCETLKVQFINESRFYNRFFLEYGDGSVLDSINFNTHDYSIFDRSLPFQKFKPVLSVIDSFGCFVQFQGDSILVLKGPEAKFTVNRDTGCSALEVNFSNRSIGGVSFRWDFQGDGNFDNSSFSPRFIYPAGDFKPMLEATANNGCKDTAKNLVFIKAWARPDVSFTMSKDTACYFDPVSFSPKNLPSDSDIVNWEWDFGDPYALNDTSTLKSPTFRFRKPGLNQVALLVRDIHQCTDTFDRFIYVFDTFGPVSTPIHYVTVLNNKDIGVSWGKTKAKNFYSYNLYNDLSNVYTLQYSSTNRNDTGFTVLGSSGINVGASRYCYVIRSRDLCRSLGAVTYPHCTVFLQISDDTSNELTLNWLPYEGWGPGNVLKYRIYRSVNGGPFAILDSTSNSVNTYTDKKLCPKVYCYYVEAVQKNGKWTSRSNTVCKTSRYTAPVQAVNSIRTTVLDNNTTYTSWNAYRSIRNVDHYIVSRAYQGSSEQEYYAKTDSLGFIDKDPFMTTNYFSYTYKIRAVDHCGAESPKSVENKTILLTGKSEGYVARLGWTEYRKWFSGVKRYEVLLREDNSFKLVGQVDTIGSVLKFDFTDTKMDDSLCFKIKAVKDTSVLVESMSNMLCLISDAKMFVPNAFTPNKDGKNEVFIPSAIMIFNKTGNPIMDYRLEIYNRWGEMVFESNDANTGWDGTYQGKPCQDGNYVYMVRALGLDGVTTFNFDGVLTLLR